VSITLIAGFLAWCTGLSAPGPICTCVPGGPLATSRAVRDVAKIYDAILDGVIVKIEYIRVPVSWGKEEHSFHFASATIVVGRQWRGRLGDTVVVRSPSGTAACGLSMEEGQRFLVFAQKDEEDGHLYAIKCGLSRAWDEEAARLARLLGRARRRD
jgi:hypothetical protein